MTDSEIEANAHLIAAAPDLLAACKAAMPIVRAFTGKGFDETYAMLAAAVSKSEGGAA